MKKIKQFVKDHKKTVIGVIGGVGGTAACVVAYKLGLKKGNVQGLTKAAAMIYADLDGTAMIVESWVSYAREEELKNYIALGNELIKIANKGLA